MQNNELILHPYVLAMFDGEGDGNGDGAGSGDGSGSGSGDGGGSGDGNKGGSGNGEAAGDGGKGRGSGDGSQQRGDGNRGGDRNDRGNERSDRGTRDGGGRYASTEDYERRISELNEENKTRRRENNELRGSVTVLEQRAIRSDAEAAISSAGAINERIVELFLADNAEHIKVDRKTGKTVGLDRLTDWKKANPAFFKADESGDGAGNGEGEGSGAGDGAGDGKGKDGKGGDAAAKGGEASGKDGKKGRNATANGGSQGSGAGTGGNTGGLPDLRNMNAEDRAKAMRTYLQSTRAGSSGAYGRATSKQRGS